jgi:hypothetical protein
MHEKASQEERGVTLQIEICISNEKQKYIGHTIQLSSFCVLRIHSQYIQHNMANAKFRDKSAMHDDAMAIAP